jgi:hypothetical protein
METARLTSRELRVGDTLYQVFRLRNKTQQEAFRVDVGFYTQGQLVANWTYGLILEQDMNGDGTPDYVWYGDDDTGLRLLWFLSNGGRYDCINVLKTAERAWMKRFAQPAPDLEEVFGDHAVEEVTWNRGTRLLSVSVEVDRMDSTKAHKVLLRIRPVDFLRGRR